MSTTKAQELAEKNAGALANIIGKPALPLSQGSPPLAPVEEKPDPYTGAKAEKTFAYVPINKIDRDPDQPREEFDEADLADLAASIRDKGQLTPIRVRPNATGDGWLVLVGERRWRGCQIAGLDKVLVQFVTAAEKLTPAAVLEEQVVENVVRAAFKPAEEGKAYRRLMDLKGWTPSQLADGIKVNETAVHRALGLARLPDDVAALVDSGKVKATAGYEVSKLADAEDQREVTAAIVEHNLGHKETVAIVKAKKAAEKSAGSPSPKAKKKGKSEPEHKPPTFERFNAGGAVVSVGFQRWVEPRKVLEALEAAVAKCREKVEAAERVQNVVTSMTEAA